MGDMKHAVFLIIGCVVVGAFAYNANAQGVQSYLRDKNLAASHMEVVIPGEEAPHLSWWGKLWSYVGIRGTTRIHPKEGTVLKVVSSAYASSPYQTDSTPCITAAGTTVRPGVVATNFLPLGTIVSIDEKRYIVEDRMNSRYDGYYLDVWFPSTSEALEFGRKKLDVTIVAYDKPGAELSPSPSPIVAEAPSETFWQSVTSSASALGTFLFTRTYNDPNRYDINCTE